MCPFLRFRKRGEDEGALKPSGSEGGPEGVESSQSSSPRESGLFRPQVVRTYLLEVRGREHAPLTSVLTRRLTS